MVLIRLFIELFIEITTLVKISLKFCIRLKKKKIQTKKLLLFQTLRISVAWKQNSDFQWQPNSSDPLPCQVLCQSLIRTGSCPDYTKINYCLFLFFRFNSLWKRDHLIFDIYPTEVSLTEGKIESLERCKFIN